MLKGWAFLSATCANGGNHCEIYLWWFPSNSVWLWSLCQMISKCMGLRKNLQFPFLHIFANLMRVHNVSTYHIKLSREVNTPHQPYQYVETDVCDLSQFLPIAPSSNCCTPLGHSCSLGREAVHEGTLRKAMCMRWTSVWLCDMCDQWGQTWGEAAWHVLCM